MESDAVRVVLRVQGDDPDEVRNLRSWLQEERDVRAHGDLRYADTLGGNEMGVGVEMLSLIVGSGLTLVQLGLAIAQWRDTRRAAPTVTITRETEDGRTVTIETSDPAAVEAAMRELSGS
ncbi:effector-associated constant component EACC1 [Catenuloplanes atrovinosus]|uniref:Uncharacterized protein n=1 Tax=Catenuloplanes atrovinosus TaxID=137266 RepID=A0AAE3YQ01_9ACTN|nr:hypothetical protein [Catenuloplanes atrovinosus]MDR7276451.1 hypothetical protein [Catenuloplanes atrovinosus]